MPPRRIAARSTPSEFITTQESENDQQTATAAKSLTSKYHHFAPATKIYMGVAFILIVAAINIGYQSYETMSVMDLQFEAKARQCLLEFSKKQCSLLNPTQDCRQSYQCIRQNGDQIEDALEVILSQTQENYLPPVIVSTFLLIFQLVENVKQIRV